VAPLTWRTALTSWQFAPLVSAVLAAFLLLYAVSAIRVRRQHPARPWPATSTLAFLCGLSVVAIATQSSVGVYDDVLFSDHMVQHVLLIMVAPPLLVLGRPVTLALHAWGNPVHSALKRVIRSRLVSELTRPAVSTALYCAVVAGTHTPLFMDLVLRDEGIHDAEHALYLAAGYLFFLTVLGTEPLRHRVSAIGAFLMLLITMLADSATGVAYTVQSREVFTPYAQAVRDWGPSLVADLHLGGYIMFTGSDLVMVVIAIALAARFFLRADSAGFLPAASRPGGQAGGSIPGAQAKSQLDAYNEYLRHLSSHSQATRQHNTG
jgi:cytochrome c oxidase assembly factor CtaG